MSFVRNLLLRGAGIVPAIEPRRAEVLPELEQPPEAPIVEPARADTGSASDSSISKSRATEPGAPIAPATAAKPAETLPPLAADPAQSVERPASVLPRQPVPPLEPIAVPGNDRWPEPPAVHRETVILPAPAISANVIRETRETVSQRQTVETKIVREATLPVVEPRRSDAAAVSVPDPVPVSTAAANPEPPTIEVQIGSIEIVQTVSAPAPGHSAGAQRRMQARGFAGLTLRRQYADRRWY